MKLINTTDFPNVMLRRMVSWCCRRLDLPARYIREAKFQNRSYGPWSGHCKGRAILVRVGPDRAYPSPSKTHRTGTTLGTILDRTEGLVMVTIHELAHSVQQRVRTRTRARGGWGGSEAATDALVFPILEAFRKDRDSLLAEWSRPAGTVEPAVIPMISPVIESRAAKAQAMLDAWERKLKLAKTKVAKYRKRVRYYEKRHGIAAIRRPK